MLGPLTLLSPTDSYEMFAGINETRLGRRPNYRIKTAGQATRPSSSPPTLEQNSTSPASHVEAPGELNQTRHPFDDLSDTHPVPMGTPASRAALHSFATYTNATLLRQTASSDPYPGRQHRFSFEIPSSLDDHYIQRLLCMPTVLGSHSPQVLIGNGSNSEAIARSHLALTDVSPSEVRAAKKSRQGRHRTACDRCRWRKSKVRASDVPC